MNMRSRLIRTSAANDVRSTLPPPPTLEAVTTNATLVHHSPGQKPVGGCPDRTTAIADFPVRTVFGHGLV